MLNCLRGRVIEVGAEPGASTDLRIDLGGAEILARITRHSVGRLQLAPGKEVWTLVKAVSLDRPSVGYA
ncbi:MAG: TOBE domain-containing protein [Burkholderiales bacterium]|nr:TOBE domain-containing protein [Burkholderiales bacterium]